MAHRKLIDASDPRLREWLTALPPRQELVVRMALRLRAKNLGRSWDARVDELTAALKIDTTAETVKLLSEVRAAGEVVEKWFELQDR